MAPTMKNRPPIGKSPPNTESLHHETRELLRDIQPSIRGMQLNLESLEGKHSQPRDPENVGDVADLETNVLALLQDAKEAKQKDGDLIGWVRELSVEVLEKCLKPPNSQDSQSALQHDQNLPQGAPM